MQTYTCDLYKAKTKKYKAEYSKENPKGFAPKVPTNDSHVFFAI